MADKLTTLEQLRLAAAQSKTLSGEVAQAAADAIEEQEGTISALSARLRELTEMYIAGEITTMLLDSDGCVLCDSDGLALINTEKMHILS